MKRTQYDFIDLLVTAQKQLTHIHPFQMQVTLDTIYNLQ